jgi:hypothetical protein
VTDDDLRNLFHAMREENTAAHAETRRQFEETVDRISAENRQYFEVATEAFKHQVGLIAEKVIGVTEELRRETADIRLEMRTGFADTQAMIRFSHAELERRVRALEVKDRAVEETLADVQARLERLEASTH